jgi:hypothetical protein
MSSQYVDIPSFGDYHWKSPVATAAALPATGNTGDIRLVIDTSTVYTWNGSSWVAIS